MTTLRLQCRANRNGDRPVGEDPGRRQQGHADRHAGGGGEHPEPGRHGQGAYTGGGRDDIDITLDRELTLAADAAGLLTFDAYWEIEEDWDYGYVMVKDGDTLGYAERYGRRLPRDQSQRQQPGQWPDGRQRQATPCALTCRPTRARR